jgi:hypothetical protein
MPAVSVYQCSDGREWNLHVLDDEEREVLAELKACAEANPDPTTAAYRNFYIKRLGSFYRQRGLTRRDTTKTPLWVIAQDLYGLMLVEAGIARDDTDFRSELDADIHEQFGSREAFCQATGLSKERLSELLSGSISSCECSLSGALARIDNALRSDTCSPVRSGSG